MDEKWRRGAWDGSEDELLRQAVKECGLRWTDISKKVGTRSADRKCRIDVDHQLYMTDGMTRTTECAKHWRNLLDPNNSRGEWTSEDVGKAQHFRNLLNDED
ncbi:MAG: hypothetical protein Q9167_005642 [Letrouitia subvulpina]